MPILVTLPIIPLTVLDVDGSSDDVLSEASDQIRVQSGMSRLDYFFTQFRVIVTYLRLLFLPVNQNLDYDYPVYTSFFAPPVYLSFLLLTALLTLALYLFWLTRSAFPLVPDHGPRASVSPSSRPHVPELRLISFGLLWFFLTLSVESSLVPIVDVIMEHRLYLPGFGVAVAFATLLYLLLRKLDRPTGGKFFILTAVLLALVLGIATWQRNHVWGDNIRLWQDVVEKSPNKGRPYNNLGVALEKAGRRQEAVNVLSRAITVDPNFSPSYYNLADLYLVSGQSRRALPLLQTAIQLQPNFTEAYISLGAALVRERLFQEAVNFLERNLDRVGDNAEARFYLGASYFFLGNREAAMRELAVVSQLDAALAANLVGLLGQNSAHGSRE